MSADPEPVFTHDVFLSHSSKDKPIVRALAERLRGDGLRVWFDEWEIKPGDSIFSRVEEGLENSRILVLCMSANAFGFDWSALESWMEISSVLRAASENGAKPVKQIEFHGERLDRVSIEKWKRKILSSLP